MTKTCYLQLICIVITSSAFAQQQNLILTQQQNEKWLDSLKKSTLDNQLTLLRERLLSDTNVYVARHYADRIIISENRGTRVEGDGKPIVVAGYFNDRQKFIADTLIFWDSKKEYVFIPDNSFPSKKIVSLTKLISTRDIVQVKVNKYSASLAALYGSASVNGIIELALNDKSYLRKFKKLGLKTMN
jgi:hypothetical protein